MGDVSRIEKLLLLVAHAQAHPGDRLASVAAAIGATVAETREMVKELPLYGKPPFGPGDLIEAWIVRPDRVYVKYDQGLGQPLALSPTEALALSVALEALAGPEATSLAGDAARAATKIRATLDHAAARRVGTLESRIHIEGAVTAESEPLAAVSRALDAKRALHVRYYTAGREETRERRIQPYALVSRTEGWYVVARDSLSAEVRVFKVDRIVEARLTDERYEIPADFDPERYRSLDIAEPMHRARVLVDAGAARALPSGLGEVEERPDGSAIVHIDYGEHAWLVSWVLSQAGAAEVLEPAALRAAVVERCRSVAAAADVSPA